MAMGLYDPAFATLTGLYGRAARGPITGITLIAGFASTIGWPLSAFLVLLIVASRHDLCLRTITWVQVWPFVRRRLAQCHSGLGGRLARAAAQGQSSRTRWPLARVVSLSRQRSCRLVR